MTHTWSKQKIAPGENSVIEPCINCNATSRRFVSGQRVYPNGNPPCGDDEPYNIAKTDNKRHVSEIMQRSLINELPLDLNARMKESLVYLNLVYDDLVKHDVKCRSRKMANRFLVSDGYKQLMNHLSNPA